MAEGVEAEEAEEEAQAMVMQGARGVESSGNPSTLSQMIALYLTKYEISSDLVLFGGDNAK